MGPLPRMAIFLACLLPGCFYLADGATPVNMAGAEECSDCVSNSIHRPQAFNVYCRDGKGKFHTKAKGKVDNHGKFRVHLSRKIIKDEECYAQLQVGPFNAHCARACKNFDSARYVFKASQGRRVTLTAAKKPGFLTKTCVSPFFFFFYRPAPNDPPNYQAPQIPVYPFPPPLPPVNILPQPAPQFPIYSLPPPPPQIPIYSLPPPVIPVYIILPPPPPPIPVYSRPAPVTYNPPPYPVYSQPPAPPPAYYLPPP